MRALRGWVYERTLDAKKKRIKEGCEEMESTKRSVTYIFVTIEDKTGDGISIVLIPKLSIEGMTSTRMRFQPH